MDVTDSLVPHGRKVSSYWFLVLIVWRFLGALFDFFDTLDILVVHFEALSYVFASLSHILEAKVCAVNKIIASARYVFYCEIILRIIMALDSTRLI